MSEQKEPVSSTEPSIWDHFVSKLRFWKEKSKGRAPSEKEEQPEQTSKFPWSSLAAILLALIAQLSLEPAPNRTAWTGIILYAAALGCLIYAFIRGEWHLPPMKSEAEESMTISFRIEFLLIGIILAVFAFLLFGGGVFNVLNTLLWLLSLIFIFLAFWKRKKRKRIDIRAKIKQFYEEGWRLQVTRWTLIVLAVIAVVLFFNFYRLDSVPPEMLSDQAEKLLDINDLLNGYTPVYFPRNTGREAIHFYLTAAYMAVFNLDVSFLNLKTVAVFANLLTLLFIYLLGKELGNKWVGLFAVLFAGMAYWSLLFTRLALRIPYYPLFVAPVMVFMVRGLRRQNIKDILWAGLFLGLGLHGYTPFRIVPLFVVLGILIYVLHKSARGRWMQSLFALVLIAFVSLVVFVPLLRYWLANPEMFAYRAFSRLTGMEVSFQSSPMVIFFQNFWKASVMFFWDNGVIWAHSVPGRPALEVVSGAFYFLGIVSLLIRYFRKRHWQDLFVLVSIPMLLMPSILSLAYPGENPSLNRTAGAVVPVFVVMAMAFESSARTFWMRSKGWIGKSLVILALLFLIVGSAANNFDLVFDQYFALYQMSSWNTSEIGQIAELFIDTIGSPETTYIVGYPHWVDSRLVAINAGYPGRDFAIFTEQIPATAENPQSKIFFLNINDGDDMQVLLETFPSGILSQYDSKVENKDFMIFIVPPSQGATP